MAHEGLAFLEEVVGDRGSSVQGLEVLAELAELRADVQEHEQDAPVCGVAAVVLHVALHLQGPAGVSAQGPRTPALVLRPSRVMGDRPPVCEAVGSTGL